MSEAIEEKTDLNWTCTCYSYTTTGIHEPNCELWQSWEFEYGWAVWDEELQLLVEIDDADADVSEQLAILEDETLVDDDKSSDSKGTGKYKPKTETKAKGKGKGETKTTTPTTTTGAWVSYYNKCRHYQEPFILPNGVTVYASSQHSDRQDDPIPDLGIYLDGTWKPDTIAFLVGCPDYGVPVPAVPKVLHVAGEGLRIATEGGRVEIGCIGGHGRTGMMLAILVVLTSEQPNGDEAIKYVRKNYCDHAIESPKQEWYVNGIAAEMKGEPWPEPPPPPKPTYYSGKSYSFKKTGKNPCGICGYDRRDDEPDPCDWCQDKSPGQVKQYLEKKGEAPDDSKTETLPVKTSSREKCLTCGLALTPNEKNYCYYCARDDGYPKCTYCRVGLLKSEEQKHLCNMCRDNPRRKDYYKKLQQANPCHNTACLDEKCPTHGEYVAEIGRRTPWLDGDEPRQGPLSLEDVAEKYKSFTSDQLAALNQAPEGAGDKSQ